MEDVSKSIVGRRPGLTDLSNELQGMIIGKAVDPYTTQGVKTAGSLRRVSAGILSLVNDPYTLGMGHDEKRGTTWERLKEYHQKIRIHALYRRDVPGATHRNTIFETTVTISKDLTTMKLRNEVCTRFRIVPHRYGIWLFVEAENIMRNLQSPREMESDLMAVELGSTTLRQQGIYNGAYVVVAENIDHARNIIQGNIWSLPAWKTELKRRANEIGIEIDENKGLERTRRMVRSKEEKIRKREKEAWDRGMGL